MRVLIVEDDPRIAGFLRKGLSEQGYAVDVVSGGDEALYQATEIDYDLVILDLIIPPPEGIEVCRRLREAGNHVPLLMLTARDATKDRITGLDAGADDYLVKPFEFGELLARIRALLRRGAVTVPSVIRTGTLEIDARTHRVTLEGQGLSLTTKEYSLLEYLARNAGTIVTREQIAEHVWNQEFDPFSNLIEVYVNRLRRSMEKVSPTKLIHTVRGAGYILDTDPASNAAGQ